MAESGKVPSNKIIVTAFQGPHWTNTRMDIHAWLQRHSPPLAELYAGSVVAIYEVHFPGRFTFICHAVREIRNRLPHIVKGTTVRPRLDYPTRLDTLTLAWDIEVGSKPFTSGQPSLRDGAMPDVAAPMSTSLFKIIANLIKDHVLARQKPGQTAALLFLNQDDRQQAVEAMGPIIGQWLNVTDWFVDRAHFTGRTDSDANWPDLIKNFELFEASLSAIDRQFFPTVEGLDEILDKANS